MQRMIIKEMPQNLKHDFKFLKEAFKLIWSLFLKAVCIFEAKLKRKRQGIKYIKANKI